MVNRSVHRRLDGAYRALEEQQRSNGHGIDDRLLEDAVLALLAAYSSDNGNAWKGFDFELMNRLHEQGFISDPVNRNKSIWLTAEGLGRGRQLAGQLFGVRAQSGQAPDSNT